MAITPFLQQTIFGKFYSVISFIIYLLLLNNPQITKGLSENVSLNNSNNFPNSFVLQKYLEMNTNKLHIITHTHTNTHNLSLSSLNTKLFYSVLQCNKNKLHPYYITGFVDGEGCFSINVRPRPNRGKGYAVELVFKITLSSKDKLLLKEIKNYFGVGRLLTQGSSISYCVKSLNELQVIVNHFDNYPLISNKWSDYQLFKQVFELMLQKEHLNSEGLNKIVSIKAVSNRGWSDKLRALFPKIIPALRPSVKSQIIPDPHWVSGFVEGEGSFYIKISSKNLVSFRFLVTQHVRDVELLKSLIIYLKCGYYLPRSNSVSHGDYFVTDLEDIKCKILPFFEKFPLQGNKLKDLFDFKKAVELKGGGNRTPLTTKNLADIKQIKQGMNKKRISDDHEKTLLDSNPSTRRPSIKSKGSAPSYLSPREGINKRHYSSTAIIRKEQPKSDQMKFFEWMAGLIDGDGEFQTTKKGFSSFKIIMGINDKKPLYEIKHKYGGYVKPISGSNALKYKLRNPKGLINLINDINGLIRNPIRMLQLNRICVKYNIKLIEPQPLTYNNGWFSGFIDSDGSIHIDEALGQLTISVTQKNKYLLNPLQNLYGGRIQILRSKEAFQYSIYRKKEILELVNNYFNKYPLKSGKANKINLIKEFYLLSDYRNLNINYINEFNQWVTFKDKWDKI